ncbi:preprotein translocase subunit SecG [Kosmotoga pacifica]|uniref:Protein-export membrane protein SecG n=1 Tax=Kosmotoga pacifica TaxID=1330330 RepID=A0A0G2ZBU5_9BACT|nr:preprotein translocase subunit SecG [Kosmotoga pacifica]AKI97024.1 preprotein translocase subunit SecG [Kosmotoga pacifica]
MVVLSYLLVVLHVVISVALVIMVLFQMSKASELGGAFGSGGTHTMFGRKKGLDTPGKITVWLSVAFMVNSVLLAYIISRAFPLS